MVDLFERTKPNVQYKSPVEISDEIRQFSDRRERRARELGIALYVLDGDFEKDDEIQRLEEYIMDNFIDFDLDVPDDIKSEYLALKQRKNVL